MSTTFTENPTARQSLITDAHKQLFKDEGYMILESIVPPEHLKLMQDKCQGFIERADADMTAKGIERSGLNAKGKRYFEPYAYKQEPELGRFIFSDLMADVCRATIGDNAFLFWDQYVVKGTDKDSAFSWHQDSGYVHLDCPMYLTCWVTLDDVTLDNGTVFLLPYSESGIRSVVKHLFDPKTNDLVGYFGKNPGLPVVLPAGSIAVFSSYVFHRSGPNLTDKLRRVFLPQYTPEIIRHPDGKQWGQAIPFLKDGEVIWKEGTPYPAQAA